ncbi:hypothetical protein HHI36_010738 [Cryptolaemus montrouzieri]|uniref:Dynein heavy chain ATP-binding dynein motor region domain-containing protein n=1 Tax=Cryptolaemus montrouzieri TaxID=559131 RepID=A0ABD2MJK6_9CUCU
MVEKNWVRTHMISSSSCLRRGTNAVAGEGLPNDKLSIQNAIMITKSNIIPLLIDPTSSAVNWIKKNMKHKQIEFITQDTPNFNNTLELSVRFGKVLIVEEVNNVSPLLLCVSRKNFIQQEQLISATIRHENPQLEERKKELVRKTEELQVKQFHLQEQLLEDMANSTGDILQNAKLIESLNETKASFVAVSKSIIEQAEIERKLEDEYDVYRHLSAFGSGLFLQRTNFQNIMFYIRSLLHHIQDFS